MSTIFATKLKPNPDSSASYAKDQRMAEIVQIRPRGPAPMPVSEQAHGPLPSRSSSILGVVLASCRRVILGLRAWHALNALDDHQLRDIGLLRDEVQSPMLAILAANRRLWRW